MQQMQACIYGTIICASVLLATGLMLIRDLIIVFSNTCGKGACVVLAENWRSPNAHAE